MAEQHLTAGQVRQLIHYDPLSGALTWKRRHRKWFKSDRSFNAWNNRFSGKRAGSCRKQIRNGYAYRVVSLFGKIYMEHQLVWLLMTGDFPDFPIDHLNRDATDNRWRNISKSSPQENARNLSMMRSNSSGVTGVSWHKGVGKWVAQCRVNGRLHHIGSFEKIKDAEMAIKDFRLRHGFSEEHGLSHARYAKQAREEVRCE